MKTLKVDAQKRVRLGHSKPGQVFAFHQSADGSITLTPVKLVRKTRTFKMVPIPVIDRLADDPEWEKMELELAKNAMSRLPRFQE